MRSSGSTRSPSEPPIRLGIVLIGDDHPRACTGRRLLRQGLVRELARSDRSTERGVVLDPYSPVPLSAADRSRAETAGLIAIDCSWNRLADLSSRRRASAPPVHRAGGRRLPMLVAANPQHFGRLGELNTAEALAAALCVLGRPRQAHRLLDGFAGGRAFLELNRARLARYARATSVEQLVRAERSLFGTA